jgi:hypothetical protein
VIPPPSGPVSGECPIRKRRRIDGRTRRPNLKHGLYTLKTAVPALGSRALPSLRTALGRELREWRGALIADLGGEDSISTQQRALVDLAVRSKLLVDSVDAYVLAMASPVNKSRRILHPVIVQRTALVAQLQGLLKDLGLERRAKPVPDLGDYLAAKVETKASATDVTVHPPAPAPGTTETTFTTEAGDRMKKEGPGAGSVKSVGDPLGDGNSRVSVVPSRTTP